VDRAGLGITHFFQHYRKRSLNSPEIIKNTASKQLHRVQLPVGWRWIGEGLEKRPEGIVQQPKSPGNNKKHSKQTAPQGTAAGWMAMDWGGIGKKTGGYSPAAQIPRK